MQQHPISTVDMEQALDSGNSHLSRNDCDDLLEAINEEVEDYWSEQMKAVENGNLKFVDITEDALILSDQTGEFWQTQFDALVSFADLIGVEFDGVPETIVAAHHNAAYRLTDFNWSNSNPVVMGKPSDFNAAQLFVESLINYLISEGLTPGQAWSYYAVEIRGFSRNSWAKRRGYSDHSTVSQAVRKAKEKIHK